MNTIEIIRTEKKEEEKTFSIGQSFIDIKHNNDLYMLTSIGGNRVCLIRLKDGVRVDAEVCVNSFTEITLDELNEFSTSTFLQEFTPVDVKITVTL